MINDQLLLSKPLVNTTDLPIKVEMKVYICVASEFWAINPDGTLWKQIT